MNFIYNPRYPSVNDLKKRAKKRIPKFAYDYLVGGCNDEISLARNYQDISAVQLRSELMKPFSQSDMTVNLFGHQYSAPFGIAPVGLQGLMWPKAPEILAKAALELNIPYVLSTVSSSSLESISCISEGRAWYQLYNPTEASIRKDLLSRLKAAQYSVLVVTVDVPTFGYRHRDIRNGLSMPPRMSVKNILQMLSCPSWLFQTILAGKPQMETLKPYMPKGMPVDELANFMNKTVMGAVDSEHLKWLRDEWPGTLIIKGLINEVDVEYAVALGVDGVVISNHGGRQLDAGESPIEPLKRISNLYSDKVKIIMDSGLNSGPNIACAIACGAHFTLLGRAFVYGVSALGSKGAHHTINILKSQLYQTLNQLRCEKISDLPKYLVG